MWRKALEGVLRATEKAPICKRNSCMKSLGMLNKYGKISWIPRLSDPFVHLSFSLVETWDWPKIGFQNIIWPVWHYGTPPLTFRKVNLCRRANVVNHHFIPLRYNILWVILPDVIPMLYVNAYNIRNTSGSRVCITWWTASCDTNFSSSDHVSWQIVLAQIKKCATIIDEEWCPISVVYFQQA